MIKNTPKSQHKDVEKQPSIQSMCGKPDDKLDKNTVKFQHRDTEKHTTITRPEAEDTLEGNVTDTNTADLV